MTHTTDRRLRLKAAAPSLIGFALAALITGSLGATTGNLFLQLMAFTSSFLTLGVLAILAAFELNSLVERLNPGIR